MKLNNVECAQCDPPLAELPPLQAIFAIPLSESPRLRHPERFSEVFVDLVERCLQKVTYTL